jgi:hypothetical protein
VAAHVLICIKLAARMRDMNFNNAQAQTDLAVSLDK